MTTLIEFPPSQTFSTGGLRPRLHRFTVAQYHQLIDAGILKDAARVELLEGWIVEKMMHKPIHDATIQQIIENAMRWFPAGWSCRPQCAITPLESEPEPDCAIVRGTAKDYRKRHPSPEDVALIIEVADSSLSVDRQWKSRIYGRAGIPAYWIINLVDWCIECFSDPTGPGENPSYRQTRTLRNGETIELSIGGTLVRVPVSDLLMADS